MSVNIKNWQELKKPNTLDIKDGGEKGRKATSMMHLTILALGSRGDVLPYVVLGRGLHDAGFAVRVITFSNFAPMVAQYGLDYYPVPGDAEALLTSSGGVALAESGQSVWKMWRTVKALFWQLATGIADVLSQPHI